MVRWEKSFFSVGGISLAWNVYEIVRRKNTLERRTDEKTLGWTSGNSADGGTLGMQFSFCKCLKYDRAKDTKLMKNRTTFFRSIYVHEFCSKLPALWFEHPSWRLILLSCTLFSFFFRILMSVLQCRTMSGLLNSCSLDLSLLDPLHSIAVFKTITRNWLQTPRLTQNNFNAFWFLFCSRSGWTHFNSTAPYQIYIFPVSLVELYELLPVLR